MKILIIHNHYQRYGGEDAVVEAEKRLLVEYNHKVILYERSNTEINKYSFLKKIGLYFNMHWSEDDYLDIKNLIQKEEPDIAHIHNTFLLITPSAYYACKELNVPIVQTLHNYRFLCPGANFYRNGHICEECLKRKNFRKGILNGCWRNSNLLTAAVAKMLKFHYKKGTFKNLIDCYIALSKFSKNKFIKTGFNKEKIIVKPNFVNFDPGERREIGNYALFAGRLSTEKGIWTLVKALKKIDKLPLKIIGTGNLSEVLMKYSKKRSLNIEFLGQKENKEVINYIKNSTFVIVPSECYETFGQVIIESFACGVPVIASRIGAIGEIIQEGKTGLLFEAGNPDDLNKKINNLYKNIDLIKEMGKNARKEYEEKYTPKKNYEILMNIYQNVIKRL